MMSNKTNNRSNKQMKTRAIKAKKKYALDVYNYKKGEFIEIIRSDLLN